jgi:hypothetical protein
MLTRVIASQRVRLGDVVGVGVEGVVDDEVEVDVDDEEVEAYR